jgi:hypothetical protein
MERTYIGRMFQFTSLAAEIVQAILAGDEMGRQGILDGGGVGVTRYECPHFSAAGATDGLPSFVVAS